ncbi:SDR family NAD(P)-dependent oxidoreductase [Streptomyces microflavus]|uniref:SDR family NAD(P)-dependent oxidoreductase n=1 Tax=Streptomyces microflavus TaxID=1919 RepID=UPI0033BA2461
MKQRESRRRILEQVRSGELSVAEATALIGPGADRERGDLRCFSPGWELGEPLAPLRSLPGGSTVVVVDHTDGEPPAVSPPPGAVMVHATREEGFHRESGSLYRVGVLDDAGWNRLWRESAARGTTPERVVIVTGAGPDRCLDVVYPVLRTLIRERVGKQLAVACVAVGRDRDLSADALGGLCGIAALEDRRLHMVSLAAVPSADAVPLALSELERSDQPLAQVRHDSDGRWVRVMPPVELPWRTEPEFPDQGVYLVSGGAGGIGLALAGLLAERSRARFVLLGRSEPDTLARDAFTRIERAGGRVRYVRGDVTKLEDVRGAVAVARSEFGPLTGVLHLAGVNEDAFIANKPPGAHQRVLAPKILGARNLDEATRDESLRLFVVFSSMAAYVGHPGQGDYAAAGRALGAFATRRGAQVSAGRRTGTTVSIGWPLWSGGGMRLSENDERAVGLLQGMTAMPPHIGLAAMAAALEAGAPESVVLYGDTARIDRFVASRLDTGTREAEAAPEPAPAVEDRGLVPAAQTYLLELITGMTRMRPGQLRPDQEFSALGIDSVMVKRLSVALEDFLGRPMPVTLLFEHRTVEELARQLATSFEEPLRAALGRTSEPTSTVRVPDTTSVPAVEAETHTDLDDAVAVVGIAGRYPGAADLEELWDALSTGRDCTGEIPADRWDKDRWFDEGDRRPGSSYGRWGGFLSDVTRFDSLFFSIAPREAERMDPAERLFLEVAWSALEDAGYSRARLHRHTRTEEGHAVGVFVGTTGMAYGLVGAEQWGRGNPVSAYSMEFSLANRLSYFLDTHGPSMSVDTACSGSLTALHLACESLRHGESRMAIAGGAYLNLHPTKFAMLSEQRMMSPDGVCRPFGEGGNGFVPGEGVGAVVLKPLRAALADGDHVHAVIRATSIGHGGKTNGYTVPSPKAHATVVRSALRRAGIDPRTIGYVEAHGTGTELGDPIEIEGLSRAFAEHTEDRRFCSIGSVKSNIGHAEAAAGIAGLTKVLLQMRHRTLVPTLHSDPPNAKIDFEVTPFRLQRSLEPWQPGPGGSPRRAALSSFGAGGANAHAIIEEYEPAHRSDEGHSPDGEELVLLSARTPDRLVAVAERLAKALSLPGRPGSLRDIAHTLRVGREHLEHRMALVVGSVGELSRRLDSYARERTDELTGHVGEARVGTPAEGAGKPPTAHGRRELAELWVRGGDIETAPDADTSPEPRIVPLPAYPFAGPAHWADVLPPDAVRADRAGQHEDPPLTPVGETEQATGFQVGLQTSDPVVADHVIDGRPILAGVVHLELVRAAANRLTGRRVGALTDVRWRVPLDLGLGAPVVRLREEGDGIAARIVMDGPDGEVVHSTFTAVLAEGTSTERLDLGALRARCARSESGASFYDRAKAHGLSFGPSYRLVRHMWCGEGEALSELAEPPGGGTGWWLEPGATDAALHTLHGAVPTGDEPATLPVSAERVELLSPSGRARFAHARLTSADPDSGTVRCDVVLYDESCRPLVRFAGLTAVRPQRPAPVPAFRPVWRLETQEPHEERPSGPVLVFSTSRDHGLGEAIVHRAGAGSRLVDIDGLDTAEAFAQVLRGRPEAGEIYFLGGVEERRYSPTDLDHLELSQRRGCLALFHLAQALAGLRPPTVRLTVLTNDTQQVDERVPAAHPFAASLHGMTRTLSRELSFLRVVCVDLSGTELARCAASGAWDTLLARVAAEPSGTPHREVALREGARMVKRLEPATLPEPDPAGLPLRTGGRYLIVGGTGGLGNAVGTYLAQKHGARLLVVGRRPEAELPTGLLEGLRRAGAEVDYMSADVTDPVAMRAAVARMRERFGGVDGVIHTAFVLADRTIARADDTSFRAALDPKTKGTVALCDALGAEPLDFLALFSSAIAYTGNPGQSNYAAGSTFQDAYGLYLATGLHWPVTVFDWGFWGDHGAVATDEHRRRLADWGVQPLSDDEGVRVFRQALAARVPQVAPLKVSGALADVTPMTRGRSHTAEPPTRPSLLDGVAKAVRSAVRDRGEPFAADYLDAVDDYGRRLVLKALTAMGLPGRPAAADSEAALRSRLGVVPGQSRLFGALLAGLIDGGLLQGGAPRVEALGRPAGELAITDQRTVLLARFAHLGPTLDLMEECAAALPQVLTGARRGLEVLFPGGSDRRLAALYHDDPRTRHFNDLCTVAIEEAVRARLAEAASRPTSGLSPARAPDRLRVLEIGAGTGGTTRPLLEMLDRFADSIQYDITDISPSLVGAAKERFGGGRTYTAFRTLDISVDPARQEFGADRYDLVLATNVLHATADVRATLRHVSALMKPGALLVVNEATRVLDSITPVFGLTDGWWLSQDEALRLPHSPLLSPGTWSALLIDAGMRGVRRFGIEGWTADQAGQQLIIAERGDWRAVSRPPSAPDHRNLTAQDPQAPEAVESAPRQASRGGALFDRTVAYLLDLYVGLLKLGTHELDPRTPLVAYGTDSLTTMEAVELLERRIGPVPQEILTAGESVEAIAHGLVDRCGPQLAAALLPADAAEEVPSAVTSVAASPAFSEAGETGSDRDDPSPRASRVVVEPDHGRAEPVAIVGLAGRYPGATTPDGLWEELLAARSAIEEVPPARWRLADHDDPTGTVPGRSYHRWGAFLDDIDRFDSLLFRISPREAERIDPAERLFLETAWEAMEDAAWPPSRLRAADPAGRPRVGVFVGMMHHGQYQLLATEQWGRGHRVQAASSTWSIANRVSHTFGFAGPSMAVDTACSSSLTALHLAAGSVRRGECSAALVGGVNLILHPSHHLHLSTAKMLSREGRSRAFDTEADGMVTGEGVGAVVLKRLTDALRDGDRIYACVLGSSVNSDGTTAGYAVPSAEAQVELIEDALRAADAEPGSVQYIEAQATGSPAGDPVELAALRRAYRAGSTGTPLMIGSVKPNIGHLEAASGMAQLTKVLLQLRHEVLVPTLGADGPLTADGFHVPRAPTPWPSPPSGALRRAAVSSFGAGGANAHVILEEAPAAPHPGVRSDEREPTVLLLSARRTDQLAEHARRLRDYLAGPGAHLSVTDVAHTLRVGREPLPARLAAVVRTLADVIDVLDAYVGKRPDSRLLTSPRTAIHDDTRMPGSPAAAPPTEPTEAARAWIEGRPVDWSSPTTGRGRVVSLPSYPFAENRYWLDLPAQTPTADGPPSHHEEPHVTEQTPTTAVDPTPIENDRRSTETMEVQESVIASICALLGVSRADIDLEDHLSDFGFDSVTMVQLADRLGTEFALDLSPAVLYGCRDVSAVVAHLAAARTELPVRGAAVDTASPAIPPGRGSTTSPSVRAASEPQEPLRPVRTPAAPSGAEPVAVVGMAGAFPGSPDLEEFWNHLAAGHDLIRKAPSDRFGTERGGPDRMGGFLDGVDRFDAEFFQITPREARVMDPQHRLFLQTVWAAIEEAGYDPADLAGTACGLYVGVASSEYGELARERGVDIDGQLITGNDHSVLANRVSFLLDLRGPSEPVDTACSSSLVAVHRAVRAIQSGECDLAIAGGVNVILSPTGFDAFTSSGMLAADGRCKTFDHRADGYARGEGVGALLLKPLDRARADGDHIHGLITGSATNHGGRAASLTAPNPAAQAEVITRAQERAGISPEQISYVEAHGTGTSLGDPIEVAGLRTAFERTGTGGAAAGQYCGLGTVKTNVGHLETAAGIAGLIKVLLSFRHGMLPPTLHVERLNPRIELTGSPFHLVTSVRPWHQPLDPATGQPLPRRAGVSSFGFGGMNAHLVVEEPPSSLPAATEDQARRHLFVLSARDQERLDVSAQRLFDHLDRLHMSGPDCESAADIAYTLQVGRRPHAARLAAVARTLDELKEVLRCHLDGGADERLFTGSRAGGAAPAEWDAQDVEAAWSRAHGGDPRRLAVLWVNDTGIDFSDLHPAGARKRVTLPSYPFAPTSHWLPAAAPVRPALPVAPPTPETSAPAVATDFASRNEATGTRPSAPPPARVGAPAPQQTKAEPDRSARLRLHVREAIADGIGIPASEVDPEREFSSYGVDSIGAMRIMQSIQTRYGDHIPMAAILEHPSVDRLVSHLGKSYVLPDEVPVTDTLLAAEAPGAPSAEPANWVSFAEAETGVPAYCLFGDTGELSWLLHLSGDLAGEGPVFGLEAPGFGRDAEPSGGIEELARVCADAVLARHDQGPCRLVGQGIAGLIAAETARLLLDGGVEVTELLLLGTPEPGLAPGTETPAASVAEVTGTLAATWGMDSRPTTVVPPLPDDTKAHVDAAVRLLEPSAPMPAPKLRRWLLNASRWRRALVAAAATYRARPVTGVGTARVVRAVRGVDGRLGDFDRWIAPPPVVHELDREPWSLTGAAAAREIARARAGGPAPVMSGQPSPIVPINRYGNGVRSIWAHNLYGEVSYAIYLSRHLGAHKPVIGLEQLGVGSLDTGPRAYASVKDMAAHYVSELREQFPGEPYLLGGCSFGGVLAYEMAHQLLSAGEEVSHLIAIDPIMPGTEAWDSVDWGTVTAVEAEAFSLVMLGNAMCQRWGVSEQIGLSDLGGLDLDEQLGRVARHIHRHSSARPDQEVIKKQILVRHEVMLRNGDLLQDYRPEPLITPVATTLFHATQGFLAPGNDNGLPAVPRTSGDTSNGFAAFVGDRITVHEMRADHHTIAHNANLARIARTVSPLLEARGLPVGMFPASLYPAHRRGTK